jgi:GNAT superfamily N-acetyltransferase
MGSLRKAELSDTDAVAEILIQTRKAFMPYASLAHTEVEVHQWVMEVLIPSGGVTVYEENDSVLGMIAVSRDKKTSWIEQLYVTPSMVGEGIGTKLLDEAIKTLEKPIRLYTFQENTGARRFYERFGFQAIAFTDGQENEEKCPDVLYELLDDPTR